MEWVGAVLKVTGKWTQLQLRSALAQDTLRVSRGVTRCKDQCSSSGPRGDAPVTYLSDNAAGHPQRR